MGGFNPGTRALLPNDRFLDPHQGQTVYTPSTRGNPFIAFKAGGEGWMDRHRQGVAKYALGADVPTPTTDGKRIFVVNDRGILNVLAAATGELLAARSAAFGAWNLFVFALAGGWQAVRDKRGRDHDGR